MPVCATQALSDPLPRSAWYASSVGGYTVTLDYVCTLQRRPAMAACLIKAQLSTIVRQVNPPDARKSDARKYTTCG